MGSFDETALHIGTRNDPYAGEVPFAVSADDRLRHLHVIGQTGTGKSTLLEHFLYQDFIGGEGCGLIDPHGDTARKSLDFIPPERMRDAVYFNPADRDHCPALNLLGHVPADERDRVTQNVTATFRYQWADSWGARMEYILKNTIAALLDYPSYSGATLLGVPRMLADLDYRSEILRHVQNPGVRTFWEDEASQYRNAFATEAYSPIQNKVGQFRLSPILRNIIGQVKSTIDFDYIINNQKIFIANLSKGVLGEDVSNLLGSLIVTGFQLAAMKRADRAGEERVPFYLHIDEVGSFTTGSFTAILSEARKYGLGLTMAHQFTNQLHEDILAAVLGNVGTTVCFRVGNTDARGLASHFGYSASTLEELSTGEAVVRILQDGDTNAFIGKTYMPSARAYNRGERLINYSRKRYTRPRGYVEAKLAQWSQRKKKTPPRVSRKR